MYADTNLFALAALNDDANGRKAVAILGRCFLGKFQLSTSVLTYDEFVWVIRKKFGPMKALENGSAFLQMMKVRIFPLTSQHLVAAQGYAERFNLKPRDSLHLATAILAGEKQFLSEDKEFKKLDLPGITVNGLKDIK